MFSDLVIGNRAVCEIMWKNIIQSDPQEHDIFKIDSTQLFFK